MKLMHHKPLETLICRSLLDAAPSTLRPPKALERHRVFVRLILITAAWLTVLAGEARLKQTQWSTMERIELSAGWLCAARRVGPCKDNRLLLERRPCAKRGQLRSG